jgi:hypothetical protein
MSARKPEYLQLDTNEDPNAVRDRLSFMRGERVLLIWPEQGTALPRKLDLVLIQREAMRRAIRLAFVTHDAQVIQHAKDLNISTFETIGASERNRWKRGRAKMFMGRDPDERRDLTERVANRPAPVAQRPAADSNTDALANAKAARLRRRDQRNAAPALAADGPQAVGTDSGNPREDEPRRAAWLPRLLIALVVLAVIGGVVYVVVPSATVTLPLIEETISGEVLVTADPTATDVLANGVIPALTLRVEIEDVGTLSSSGSRDQDDVAATGSVVFINQTAQELRVPNGTVVTTSAGAPILFETVADAVVPGGVGNQMEVAIQAQSNSLGSRGNVEAGLINTVVGEFSDALLVRNISPTSGGQSRAVAVVTVDDRERLRATVRQQLQSRAYSEMLARLTATQEVILETLRIEEERPEWTTFSAEAGDEADNLSLTMRAIVVAYVVDSIFDRQLLLPQLSTQIGRGRVLQPDTLTVQRGPVTSVDPTSGRIRYTVSGSARIVGTVNAEALTNRLAGRSLQEALAYLQAEVPLAPNSLPTIDITPAGYPTLPLLSGRITVVLQIQRVVDGVPSESATTDNGG